LRLFNKEVELLTKPVNYDMKIVLESEEVLKEVVIFTGKTQKNNPALDIL
jgi:hypothetical protein